MTESAAPSQERVFISYRRADTAYAAGWLYDRLAERYGRDQIFKDVDSIDLGEDFVEAIGNAVGSCRVLIALIGDRWLTVADESGAPRLQNPHDFVRLEIQAALERDVRVIPVLVAGAQMPRAQQIPRSMRALIRRQALELSPNRFTFDTNRLLRVLDRTIADTDTPSTPDQPDQELSQEVERQQRQSAVANTAGSDTVEESPSVVSSSKDQRTNGRHWLQGGNRTRRVAVLVSAIVAVAALVTGLVYWWPFSAPQQSSSSSVGRGRTQGPFQPLNSSSKPGFVTNIRVGKEPQDVQVAPNGKYAYVTNSGANNISVIDTHTQEQLSRKIVIPGRWHPQFVAFDPHKRRAYVSLVSYNNTQGAVAIINTATRKVLSPTIAVGHSPYALNVDPNRNRLYVADHDDNKIAIIDLSTHHVKYIPVDRSPHCVVFSASSPRAYIANHESDEVSVLNTQTNKVIKKIPVGLSPHSLALLPPKENEIYVANFDSGNVSIISVAANKVIAPPVRVGANPQAVAFSPSGNYAYVANAGDRSVSVIDTHSRKVTSTVKVGKTPTSVSFLPNGRYAYVTNNGDDTVTVLSTTHEK